MDSKALEAVKAVAEVDDRLRAIFTEHFGVDRSEDNGFKAYATLAVEVAMAVANAFLHINNPAIPGRAYKAIYDLVVGLNSNEFWVQNAAGIMPVLHAALAARRDADVFALDKTERREYALHDALWSASHLAVLDVFCIIAFRLGGTKLMATSSLPLKMALLVYFRG